MSISKEEHRGVIGGYYYACCSYCKTTLIQGKNGTDCFVKCPQCGRYLHVIIKDETLGIPIIIGTASLRPLFVWARATE